MSPFLWSFHNSTVTIEKVSMEQSVITLYDSLCLLNPSPLSFLIPHIPLLPSETVSLCNPRVAQSWYYVIILPRQLARHPFLYIGEILKLFPD